MKCLLYLIPAGFIIYLLGYWVGMTEWRPDPAHTIQLPAAIPDTTHTTHQRHEEWMERWMKEHHLKHSRYPDRD